jgi:hypothetical protein
VKTELHSRIMSEVPAVRILPMSDKMRGFRGRSIQDVQKRCFLRDVPRNGGRFQYCSSGLNAGAGTIVLFQFQARIIASAVFVRDERFDRPVRGIAGVLHFEPASFRTFDPVDAETMRTVWPQFRNFGHVKQFLNPGRYPMFKRRLKNIATPDVAKKSRRTELG